jgi:hypothetical protein
MHGSHSYGGRGDRDQVAFVLDAKDNLTDHVTMFLHNMHQSRRGRGSGCGCGGGGCSRCCWTPATSWFDYNRAYISYMREMFECLYGRSGCGPSYCGPSYGEPDCEPSCPPGKVLVSVPHGGSGIVKFKVVNKSCDPVTIELVVDGFAGTTPNTKWVAATVENNKTVLAASEAVTISVTANPGANLQPNYYEGSIIVKTPFPKPMALTVQVT